MPAVSGMVGSFGAKAESDRLWVSPNKIEIVAAPAFTRPADTTAYADKDLVANSTTAASVVALAFTAARSAGGRGRVVGARLQKSTNSITNTAFRLHLFQVLPTFVTGGDNSSIETVAVATDKGYLGYIDITAMTGFSAVAWAASPVGLRQSMPFIAGGQTLYGFLEAKAAYTPGDSEVFTVSLIVEQE